MINVHLARFFGEDFNNLIKHINDDKYHNKILSFDDSMYTEYYDLVYPTLESCNQQPSIKYTEFIKTHDRYLLILEKQKYKKDPKTIIPKQISKESKTGFVYGIFDPSHPEWIKIGCTSDLNERLQQYQTYSPIGGIHYVHYKQVDDKFRSEKDLHEFFKDKRGLGEWFKISVNEFKEYFL